MRITLNALEGARSNPGEFRRKRLAAEQEFFPPPGYDALLKDAIVHYHQDGLTEDQARQRMSEKFASRSRLKSQDRFNEIAERLGEYVDEYSAMHNLSTNTRVKLNVVLPTGYTGHQVHGKIVRLDMTQDGTLFACVLSRKHCDWRSELRFPLIQSAVAANLDYELADVRVGVYCFDDDQHIYFQFSQPEVDAATTELCALLPLL